jgi:hypothetical protein
VNNSLIDSLKKAQKEDDKGFREFLQAFEASNANAANALKIKLGIAVEKIADGGKKRGPDPAAFASTEEDDEDDDKTK